MIGFCHIGIGIGMHKDEGQLFRLYLLPAAQGRRLGSSLLERGEHWLRGQQIASYGCFVHPANTGAIRFYQQRGFVACPERDRGDGVWYSKTL